MTDLLDAPPLPSDPPPTPPRNPALTALTVLAVLAVAALGIVAVVALNNRDSTTQLRQMNATQNAMMNSMSSMMNSSSMMGGGMVGNGMTGNGMMTGPMMGQTTSSPTIPGAREIAVTASSFSFAPNEIHVRAGEAVTIVLAATDTAHNFTIDELDFHVAAAPGQPGRGSFHAPSGANRYTAYCSIAGHRAEGMTATVVVDAA